MVDIGVKHPTSSRFIDITMQKFNRLLVLSYAGKQNKAHFWNCKCDCGTIVKIRSGDLKSGISKSCGCYKRETSTKHGGYNKPEYGIWKAMKQRCYNKNNSRFMSYGGRGITMCDRWKTSFLNFYTDMGPRPTEQHSIDRADNDGNYTPSNCQWSTMAVQNRNRRLYKSNKSGFPGVSITKNNKFRAAIKANYKQIYLGTHDTFEDAKAARIEAELKYWKD